MQKTQELTLISLLSLIFRRQTSTYFAIFGRRGSGKTDLALLIAEIVHALGLIKNVATNIKVYESPKFHIEEVNNLWALKKWCKETPGPKLMALDEIGKTVSRRTPMARLNVKIINELQILRKYKLSLEIITVDQKYTDNAILGVDLLDGVFTKPVYNNPKLALYDDNLETLHTSIYDIPRTRIKFDTWDSAPFTEKPISHKPAIKDETVSRLWDWSHGKLQKECWQHPQFAKRDIIKFVKDTLDKSYHQSQD